MVGGISFALVSVTEWLKKLWPFLPITILPISLLPLLPKIPWPPHVKPLPVPTPMPIRPEILPKVSIPLVPPNPRYQEHGWAYMQRWPLYSKGMGGGIHTGIDIPPGFSADNSITPIGPGEVYEVGKPPSTYGYYIVIKHTLADGSVVFSKYAHLQELPDLKVTDPPTIVDTNTKIGIMGDTGKANGVVHLHLEVTNKYPPVPNMNGKDPAALYPPNGPSYLERMEQDYINPIDVINGTLGWQFQTPAQK
jgi:murein DD-endopeptidase MepM/ murein hydrolase activator NlpD